MTPSITAIILTYNEAIHIARCIDNVKQVAQEIYVVDSFSTDATCEIASQHGAIVIQHEYVNQAQQFQWALDSLECHGEWVLRLDADEYLTSALILEIEQKLGNLSTTISGCYLLRDVIFLGKNMKHGRIHPPRILRLWRKGAVYMEQRWMDEQCVLKYGKAIVLKERFVDHNLQGLTWWTQKHNAYSNRELAVEIMKNYGLSQEAEGLANRNQKKSMYYRFPPFFRAILYFSIKYLLLGGFLDGKAGLIWATLQTYWYRFLVDAKFFEMQQALGDTPSVDSVYKYFSDRLGLTLKQ